MYLDFVFIFRYFLLLSSYIFRKLNHLLGGFELRIRVRVDVPGRVAGNDARCTFIESQRFKQGGGQPARLVGDDAPAAPDTLDPPQHLGHPGKQPRVFGEVFAVNVEQPLPPFGE